MTINEYQGLAMRTVNADIEKKDMLVNSVMGLCGESGEAIEILKKHIFHGKAEPYLAESENGKQFQLMRVGYYKKCLDEKGGLVLSEIVSLKDNFNK